MSLKKLAGETAIYGVSSIVGRLLNFLLVPLYTDVFPTGEYGIVSHLFAIGAMTMVFFTYRMELAYFRFGTENKEEEHQSFNAAALSIAITTLFFGIILFAFAPFIANTFGYANYDYLVRLLICIIMIDAICEIPYAKLRLEQRPIRFASIRLSAILIALGLNLFFLLFCPYALQSDSWSFLHSFLELIYYDEFKLAYIFISNLIGNSIALLLLSSTLFSIRIRDFSSDTWRKMFNYALPLVVVGIAYLMNETFDRVMMPIW
ncbi:MAG: oligosaccharide flippase family protein, partial [Bacteroidota bacterium]